MPWQPMHIEFFPFAASAFPCACAGRPVRRLRSGTASDILITRSLRKSRTILYGALGQGQRHRRSPSATEAAIRLRTSSDCTLSSSSRLTITPASRSTAGVLARNEQGKPGIAVAERTFHEVELPGFEKLRLNRVVVNGQEKVRVARRRRARRELGHEAVVADEHGLQSAVARSGFDLRCEIAGEVELRAPARAGRPRLL